ncbi:gustatory receptor for sugar taste 64f-like [Sitodiplosis mosellana]|uniref:gustatory receptor for sugar taste 64f-like n=1 Tax=Sitodiplosis mosellana TaxID=263140 RepID=UPI0024453145|nr:gustatory receptor for sugar taste 64f-like [Sitodiplosis mosellana]
MSRTTGNVLVINGSFHQAFGSVLVLAQSLGVLPVIGIKGSSAFELRFTWKSFRTIYSVTAFLFAAFYTIFATCITLTRPVTFNSVVPLTFFTTTAYGVFSFIRLARKWPKLMQHWEFVEAILPPYRSFDEKKLLGLEHILNMVSIIMEALSKKKDPLETLFDVQIPLIFTLTKLTWWKAILSKWFNVVVTFTWSFMDLFVMVVSIGLASQFKQINADLQQMKGKYTSEGFWMLRRIQYRKVVHLVFAVDDAISQIIFVTFANNLFFVCVQIVRSIKEMPSFLNKVYFWFSLTFLITRTVAVSLFASHIHDESKKPITVLRAVPNHSWCKETYRFSEEVINETVALSGLKFFFLTRNVILTVAGAIATYELVLLQLNTDT